jgi:hypothetical protein
MARCPFLGRTTRLERILFKASSLKEDCPDLRSEDIRTECSLYFSLFVSFAGISLAADLELAEAYSAVLLLIRTSEEETGIVLVVTDSVGVVAQPVIKKIIAREMICLFMVKMSSRLHIDKNYIPAGIKNKEQRSYSVSLHF